MENNKEKAMRHINALINTSVTDCRINLANDLANDPVDAARTAWDLLLHLHGKEGQAARRQVAATTLRKAVRAIADDEELDPHGPSASDILAELGVSDLRELLAGCLAKDPMSITDKALNTLVSLRGESGHRTRRKVLATAIGRGAKALERGAQS